VKSTVSNTQITIVKQSTAPASVSIAAPGTTYAYFTITKTNIQDADIKTVKLKFKVEKSWVTSNNIDIATIALNRYADGQWTKMPTTKLSEDSDYIYFEAETTALSVFAVAGQSVITTTTTLPTTTTTLPAAAAGLPIEWIVIIILVIVVILVFVFRKTLTSKKKILLPPSI
jgi:PGF-pre-PGF domain-containing protein